ncbi:MAG: hypothetical protein OHK0039_27580 [Bacteroidia bacterium]
MALMLSSLTSVQAQAPANDSICNAVQLTLGAACSGTPTGNNTAATAEAGEPVGSCFAGGANSVWFYFVAPPSGLVSLTTDFSGFTNDDTEIALYGLTGNTTASCPDYAEMFQIACDQDGGSVVNFNSIIPVAPVTAGDTFFVQVSGWNGTEGSFCLVVSEVPAPNPPPAANDILCNATVLTVGATCSGTPNGNNTNALFQPGEPFSACTGSTPATVWYSFIAPASGYVNISTDINVGGTNTSTDITLYALTDSCIFAYALSDLGCAPSFQGSGFGSAMDSVPVTPGEEYYVQVTDGQGTFCIEVQEVFPTNVPANDLLCNALPIVVDAPCTQPIGDNTNSGLQVGEPAGSCFQAPNNTIWYSFVAPPSGLITITTDIDSSFVTNDDTEIALYTLSGTCTDLSGLVEVACDQDGGTAVIFNSIINAQPVVPGQTYYIQVSGWGGTLGSFCMEVIQLFIPPSDNVCDAIALPVDGSINSFYNTGATVQPLEDSLLAPPVGNGEGNAAWFENAITESVWFTFVAPASGSVVIDFCNGGVGTDFDTQVAVYSVGTCSDFNTFTLVGANDDIPDGCPTPADFFASYLDLYCLTPGATYHMLVDGWLGADGIFGVSITENTTSQLTVSGTTSAPDCPGSTTGSIQLTVSGGSTNPLTPVYTYLWSTGATTSSLSGVGPGSYDVTVATCADTVTTTFIIPQPAALVANAGEDQTFCEVGEVTLGGNPTGLGGKPFESVRAFGYDSPTGVLYKHSVSDPGTQIDINTAPGTLYGGDIAFGVFFTLDRNNNNLVAIDTANGGRTVVGPSTPLTGQIWTGLAFDATTATMYATSTDLMGAAALYTIDLGSGTATQIGALGTPFPFWLAIDTAGLAYTLDIASNELFSVNKANGQTTLIGNVGFDPRFVQDADFDPETNILYTAAFDNVSFTTEFRSINVTTGASTFIAALNRTQVTAFAIAEETATPYTYFWNPALALNDVFAANPISSTPITFDYVVTVTDGCGTQAKDTVTVNVGLPGSLDLTSTPVNDSTPVQGTATVTVTDGTPPFTYTWSTGFTETSNNASSTATTPDSGTVSVTVLDANGCVVEGSIFVDDATAIDDFAGIGISSFNAYPNPSHGVFTLDIQLVKADRMTITVFDMKGQQVFGQQTPVVNRYEEQINLSRLASGVYMLRVETSEGQSFARITIH